MGFGISLEAEVADSKQLISSFIADFCDHYTSLLPASLFHESHRLINKGQLWHGSLPAKTSSSGDHNSTKSSARTVKAESIILQTLSSIPSSNRGNEFSPSATLAMLLEAPLFLPPAPSGDTLRTGYVLKLSRHLLKWTKTFFVLRDDWLLDSWNTFEDCAAGRSPTGTTNLSGMVVVPNLMETLQVERENLAAVCQRKLDEIPKPPPYPENTICLRDPTGQRETLFLRLQSKEEVEIWTDILEQARFFTDPFLTVESASQQQPLRTLHHNFAGTLHFHRTRAQSRARGITNSYPTATPTISAHQSFSGIDFLNHVLSPFFWQTPTAPATWKHDAPAQPQLHATQRILEKAFEVAKRVTFCQALERTCEQHDLLLFIHQGELLAGGELCSISNSIEALVRQRHLAGIEKRLNDVKGPWTTRNKLRDDFLAQVRAAIKSEVGLSWKSIKEREKKIVLNVEGVILQHYSEKLFPSIVQVKMLIMAALHRPTQHLFQETFLPRLLPPQSETEEEPDQERNLPPLQRLCHCIEESFSKLPGLFTETIQSVLDDVARGSSKLTEQVNDLRSKIRNLATDQADAPNTGAAESILWIQGFFTMADVLDSLGALRYDGARGKNADDLMDVLGHSFLTAPLGGKTVNTNLSFHQVNSGTAKELNNVAVVAAKEQTRSSDWSVIDKVSAAPIPLASLPVTSTSSGLVGPISTMDHGTRFGKLGKTENPSSVSPLVWKSMNVAISAVRSLFVSSLRKLAMIVEVDDRVFSPKGKEEIVESVRHQLHQDVTNTAKVTSTAVLFSLLYNSWKCQSVKTAAVTSAETIHKFLDHCERQPEESSANGASATNLVSLVSLLEPLIDVEMLTEEALAQLLIEYSDVVVACIFDSESEKK